MNTLSEIKEWLRIDGTEEEATLNSLLLSSKLIINQATGVAPEDVTSDEAKELYKLLQKLIITDLYENRAGSNRINPVIISMYAQLEAFKLVVDNTIV